MKLFGPKKAKPPTLTRFGILTLRVGHRGNTTTRQNIIYLRHASALSAAVAKNISSTLNQADEFSQDSDSTTKESFLQAHSRYSFITVLTLMSLFMVVTLSATGFMLAFYRKKNAVFVANPKSEADSQFELEDIANGDVETCRLDKGECYVHLSEESDDDDEVFHECSSNNECSSGSTGGRRAKRSMTFPQLHEVLKRRRSIKMDGGSNKCRVTNALTPLIRSTTSSNNNSGNPRLYHAHQSTYPQEGNKRSHQKFNHHRYLHNHRQCNKSHIQSPSTEKFHYGPSLKHPNLPSTALSKLRRSHTIHAIPQTDPRSLSCADNVSSHQHNKSPPTGHLKITNPVQVTSSEAAETPHRPSGCAAVDADPQTTSSRSQQQRNIHQEDDARRTNRKRKQDTNSTCKASSSSVVADSHDVAMDANNQTRSLCRLTNYNIIHGETYMETQNQEHTSAYRVVPTSHRTAVDANHQTSSSNRLQHSLHQAHNAGKNNTNRKQEDSTTYKSGSSRVIPTSHHVGHYTAEVNVALKETDKYRVLSKSSLSPTATAVHPSSLSTTSFYPQTLAISNSHSTTSSPQEINTVVLSTTAAISKSPNAQSPPTIHTTEVISGLLNPLDIHNKSSASTSRTRRSSSPTSDQMTRLPPPPKSSSKRQQKQTKESHKKSHF